MTVWTDERVAQVERLWRAGTSASSIAAELGNGITRNAVVGRLHRAGLSSCDRAAKVRAKVAPAPKPKAAAPEPEPEPEPNAPAAPPVPAEPRPTAAPVDCGLHAASVSAVVNAQPATCRYVLGTGRHDFAYCGARATVIRAGQLSYCESCFREHVTVPKVAKPLVLRARETIRSIRG